MTSRIERLRDQIYDTPPSVDVVRARLITKAFQENPCDPVCLQMGKALYRILDEMPICIDPGELIVGRPTLRPRAAQLYPEVQAGWMGAELATVSTRQWDPLLLDEADRQELETQIIPFWKGKTINEKVFGHLPEETKNILYRDPNVYPTQPTALIDNFSLLEKGIGTVVPNYERVLTLGVNGILDMIQQKMCALCLQDPQDIPKYQFYRAAQFALKGLLRLAERYALLADQLAQTESNPARREELHRIAQVCTRVPAQPPRDFWEAIQAFWFTHLMVRIEESGHSLSPGRFDQYLYPFYQMDPSPNKDELVLELIECCFIKFSELMLFCSTSTSKSYTGVPQWQNLNLGGKTPDGRDATNELSYLSIRAMQELKLVQPDISVRVHENTPEDFLIEACRLSKLGTGHPKFYNEDLISMSMAAKGLTIEEARDFAVMGCVEPRVQRKEGIHLTGGFINLPAGLELALNDGKWKLLDKQVGLHTGDPRSFTSFEEFLAAYKIQLKYMVEQLFIINAFAEQEYSNLLSSPFLSALTEGCIEQGKDLQHGGARYNFGPSVNMIGIADTADSLMAIKKLVFEEKKVSMEQLLQALDSNFEQDPQLYYQILNDVEKYGNDIDEVDYLLNDIVMFVNREIMKFKNIFGGTAQSGIIPVTSGITFGRVVGALPNGRKAGEPYADSVSPTPGAEKKGPTAVLKSVAKLDPARLRNGVLFNLRINPDMVKDDAGLAKFATFVRLCCDVGIWHIQFNVVDNKVLRDAQLHPAQYRDLLVRVAGYSAYFTGLHEDVQNDLIRRVQHDI